MTREAYLTTVGISMACSFAAVVLLSLARTPRAGLAPIAIGIIIAIGVASPFSPIRTGANFAYDGDVPVIFQEIMANHGIADERQFYYHATGLLRYRLGTEMPIGAWRTSVLARNANPDPVLVSNTVGLQGFFLGPSRYLVDTMALGDPFLARLPARPGWRIGHFQRDIPPGYIETLVSGQNRITNRDLAAYYSTLSLITRGPLINEDRIKAILFINMGRFDYLIPHTSFPSGRVRPRYHRLTANWWLSGGE